MTFPVGKAFGLSQPLIWTEVRLLPRLSKSSLGVAWFNPWIGYQLPLLIIAPPLEAPSVKGH